MKPQVHSTEGVILQIIPYRDEDQILSVFTPQRGLIKLFYKGSKKKRKASALERVELTYRERNSELLVCEEIHSVQHYLFLREKLASLEAGCDMLKALSSSQLGSKPAPLLYQLLLIYLEKIPQMLDPWILAASFRIKLLRHEGVWDGVNTEHIQFEEEEKEWLTILGFCQSCGDLAKLCLPEGLKERVEILFELQLNKI